MNPPADPTQVDRLRRELSLPRALCALLVTRGFQEPEAAKAFLRPSLSELHSPEALPDLSRATHRILSAIEGSETIFVHGDYDVDGMAGAALLTRWLERLGARVIPFVPHRLRDGYDLGRAGVQAALSAGASLLVTVDCGIVAHDAVSEATAAGLDVIITDHHEPEGRLPGALAVLNPGRQDSAYPNPHLCGAGVAYKLCQGLADARGIGADALHPYLDLVGLATIADLVPLTGENRVLARFGLRALAQTRLVGLQALMREAGVDPRRVTAGKVGFGLAPRLNALGRVGEAMDGLRLLLTDDAEEAARLARLAEGMNQQRQEEDQRTLREALELLSTSFDPEAHYGVVLGSEGWHPGVVGIVASRVVERVHRPTVLIAMDGERGRGSARSVPQFDILEGIRACGSHLERFGGHRQAAGLEVRRDRIQGFREAFHQEARRALEGADLRPVVSVDVEASLEEMTPELLGYLAYMGPHGIGNPGPLFLARRVALSRAPGVVGSGHLKLGLRREGEELEAIGFGLAKRLPPQALGRGPLDLVFQLKENEYRGVRKLQARLQDIRPSAGERPGVGDEP